MHTVHTLHTVDLGCKITLKLGRAIRLDFDLQIYGKLQCSVDVGTWYMVDTENRHTIKTDLTQPRLL